VFECVSVVGISSPLLQTFLLNEMILALLRVRGKKTMADECRACLVLHHAMPQQS
jgi:hypothetical protein